MSALTMGQADEVAMMEAAVILRVLEIWEREMRRADDAIEVVKKFAGGVDAPTVDSIQRLQAAMTVFAARCVGCSTAALEWWWLENNYGKKGMACAIGDEPARPMKKLKQYAAFLAEVFACAK